MYNSNKNQFGITPINYMFLNLKFHHNFTDSKG